MKWSECDKSVPDTHPHRQLHPVQIIRSHPPAMRKLSNTLHICGDALGDDLLRSYAPISMNNSNSTLIHDNTRIPKEFQHFNDINSTQTHTHIATPIEHD